MKLVLVKEHLKVNMMITKTEEDFNENNLHSYILSRDMTKPTK